MRVLKVGAALLVSVGAFGSLVGITFAELRPEDASDEALEIVEETVAPASIADDGLDLIMPDELPPEPPPPSGVEIPSFAGMTGLRALRRARELGFEVDLRDARDRTVRVSERRWVRVSDEGQSPPAGAHAEPGSTVQLRTDEAYVVVSGY